MALVTLGRIKMSEIRFIETYEQGTGKLLRKEPYEVSNKELAEEIRAERMVNIFKEIDALKARIEKLETSR